MLPTRLLPVSLLLCFGFSVTASAEIRLASIFGDHMVLQRDKPIHVWGWAEPGSDVSIQLAGHAAQATSGSDGRFDAELDPLPAGGPHEMVVNSGEQRTTFADVLVGEVWVCSGQSNMEWPVERSDNADLETMAANYPDIRLISVPKVGTQEPQDDFDGRWESCTPETVRGFSAVGYFFGRQLHQTLGVPIGLIDNAWGGSAAEAWVPRDVLRESGNFDPLLEKWRNVEATFDHDGLVEKWQARLERWKETRQGPRPARPRNQLTGQHRPANLFNGVLNPTIGYTIRGVIWYQGESNSGRAYQYRELFPLMIQTWRDRWQQGDFPFYWVQLADFRDEVDEPEPSSWAELREAQTMTMDKLPNTGEAVILNLGEAKDIHPRNKQRVAARLARWALANDYGREIPHRSPQFESISIGEGRATLKFASTGAGLTTFDVNTPLGFAIAGDDQRFVFANAKIVDANTIEVWSDQVSEPVAVRYAWANNPVCNVQSRDGLPLTPFRTDTWKGVTADVVK